jgi:hypothetical protein
MGGKCIICPYLLKTTTGGHIVKLLPATLTLVGLASNSTPFTKALGLQVDS